MQKMFSIKKLLVYIGAEWYAEGARYNVYVTRNSRVSKTMINGIGNNMPGQNLEGHVHHVTECIHKEPSKSLQGGMAMQGGVTLPEKENVTTTVLQETAWSPFQWLSKVWNNGWNSIKELLGTNQSTPTGENVKTPVQASEVMASLPLPAETNAHKTAGYFVPAREDATPNTWYQRLRERTRIQFGSIRSSLAKYLKQDQSLQMGTSKNGSFTKKEKEDRSRLSVYREDDVEIECIITDDSYLLDSYNRKGDYSKLGK